MNGHRALSAVLLAALCPVLLGCKSRQARQPASPLFLVVDVSGCGAYLSGSRCELPRDGQLRLWVQAPDGVSFHVATETAAITQPEPASPAGRLISVKVPSSAKELRVLARMGNASSDHVLPLAPGASVPLLDEVSELRQAGKSAEALERARQGLGSLSGGDRARALGLIARIELSRGHSEEAIAALREGRPLYRGSGRISDAFDDAMLLAYTLVQYGPRYGEARKVLEEAAAEAAGYPDGKARLPYYQGFVAARTGDVRTALGSFREAHARASRLGMARLTRAVRQELAELFQALGRWGDALQELKAARAETTGLTGPCEEPDLLTNMGWVALLSREPGANQAGGFPAPSPLLEQALGLYEKSCPDPHRKGNVLLNLALAALQEGRPQDALARLALARQALSSPSASIQLWWLDIEGRVALLEKKPKVAQSLYERLSRLAEANLSPEASWRAALGSARALRDQRKIGPSLEAYAKAEALLDDQRLWVPVGEGRDTFLAGKEQSAMERVALLLTAGRADEALLAARRSRSRVLLALQRADRLGQLAPEARARWEEAIGAYRRERAALDVEAASDWQLSSERLALVLEQRKSREGRLKAVLDEAFRALSGNSSKEHEVTFRQPGPGELLVAYHPIPGGHAVLAADGAGVVAEHIGIVDPAASAAVMADTLLGPISTRLEKARKLLVLPHGALVDVDFHALPWNGKPLVSSKIVEYPLDLPARAVAQGGVESVATTALVVGDPLGDLPVAGREAEAVAAALGVAWKPTLLRGSAATSGKVLDLLGSASLFHYSGHGMQAGRDGLDSALLLSEGGRITVGDVLALSRVPKVVVLSGCETARAPSPGPTSMGLAHAFLLAGAQGVVAATRPVGDTLASQVTTMFYRVMGANDSLDVGTVVGRAQAELAERSPTSDWAAFRVLIP
ncbi:MAG: CHAT domain-containing protein [Deltaproteobacteria bacterium]|nr:CHAT domain-containing protein [Deltaproteobacteria bacterium]